MKRQLIFIMIISFISTSSLSLRHNHFLKKIIKTPIKRFCSAVDELNLELNRPKKIKVRQHVNPLSLKYMAPLDLADDWLSQAYADPTKRLFIDIGCAKGTWALNMAKEYPQYNFLGLEIRRPCVQLAMERKQNSTMTNVHYLASNVNVDMKRILTDINNNNIPIELITAQFPDPQFKKKHQKRKAVNDQLVQVISEYIPSGTRFFVQSDLDYVTMDMLQTILNNTAYIPADGYSYETYEDLKNNKPITHIKTEREIATEAKGLPVFRMLLKRK